MNESILQTIGMNTKEARAYLKLLTLGSAGASTLARQLNINRTSCYSLLGNMVKRGFVSFYEKKSIKYYSATDPRILLEHNLSNAKMLFDYLPELMAIQNEYGQKPKITFYDGVEGIKQVCESLLEVPGSIRDSFMGIEEKTIHPEIKKYFEEDFLPRRIKKGIKYRGITTGYLPHTKKYPQNDKGHNRELKHIDPKKFPIKIHIDIYPHNKVALYSYHKDEMMGVIIESASFFTTMKTVFSLAWQGI